MYIYVYSYLYIYIGVVREPLPPKRLALVNMVFAELDTTGMHTYIYMRMYKNIHIFFLKLYIYIWNVRVSTYIKNVERLALVNMVFAELDTTGMYICIYICIYIYLHVFICIRIYTHKYIHKYIYIYIYIHMVFAELDTTGRRLYV
jgi:hypothetical protein